MTDKKLTITSIETDITDNKPDELTTDTLELKTPIENKTSPKPYKYGSIENLPTDTNSTTAPDFSWVRKLTMTTYTIWLLLVIGLLVVVLNIDTNWQTYTALQWAAIIGLVLGPSLMIFVAGYALKQLAKISKQAFTLAQSADALSTPDNTVIRKSKVMAHAIAAQVDQVNEKLNQAVERLASMEEVIQGQTDTLNSANLNSRETVDKINESVETQNATLASMTASLETNMESLSKNLTMHTDNLAKSVQIAEQKIKEARISVEGATSKINSASDIVRSNTVQASATLSASHEDIKSLGDIIRQRSEELDDVYKKHAGELTAMIEHLRDEQSALGASMEERLVKMRDLSLSAQASAESLTKASSSGKETIEALAAAASLADNAVKTRFSEMRDMVEYSTEHAQSISDMAAKRVQDSLELTRKEIIRIEQEMADLQTRIGNKKHTSLELVPDDVPKDEPTDIPKNTKTKKQRTRLKLKPILDIKAELKKTEIVEPEPIPEPEPEPEPEPKPEPESQEQEASLALGEDLLEPDILQQSTQDIKEDLKEDIKEDLKEDLEPIADAVQTDSNIEQNQTNEAFPNFHPTDEAVRRTAPLEEPKKQKSKKQKPKSGLLRGLFSGRAKANEASALDIVGNSSPEPLNQNPPPTDDEIFLADLAKLGLSANVVVDAGCIIEATNARATSGHTAMSASVAHRLKQPVEHLVRSLTVDDDLSDKAIIFATHFDRSIELLARDREAIRARLECEKGRAYLLCDAALNYGRV